MNCNDALLLETVHCAAKEQRLAVASVRTAVKVRGEDVFINTNLMRWQDELAGYFTYVFNCIMPPTLFGDCCLVCGRETYFPLPQI